MSTDAPDADLSPADQATDAALRAALAGDRPPAALEDRVIARLRAAAAAPPRLSPPAGRAAVAAAAVAAVVGMGWVGTALLAGGGDGRPRTLARSSSTPEAWITPRSNAEKWDFGGGSSSAQNWVGWSAANNYFYADPSATGAVVGRPGGQPGWNGADANGAVPGSAAAGLPRRQAADLQKNPFAGTQHDNVYTGRDAGRASPLTSSTATRGNAADSIVLPDADATVAAKPAASPAFRPQAFGFTPTAKDGKPDAADRGADHPDYYMGGRVTESGKFDLGRPAIVLKAPVPADGQQHHGLTAGVEFQLPIRDPHQAGQAGPVPDVPPSTRPAVDGRKVIRTGVMAFDVDRFDAAADTLAKVVSEAGGYVATTDSQKLPNGKTTGTVTVRCPPERLDLLVLSLRALGELKSQQITAQDVTKEFTDAEGELAADRAMQDRLLDLIRTGKGSIKDLLAAETELGNWRVKIEKLEGQLRYLNSQIGLSTLAVTLSEKDIRQAAAAVETETADMGVEADDVERARDAAVKAIDDAHGRVIEAELKRLDAGQLAARIVADVPPEAAGATVDRLKQLGRVARLEVHRQQVAGGDPAVAPVRTERRPTRIVLSVYNLANVAPRRTTAVTLAAADPEAAYAALLALANPGGRVVTSNLDRSANATGTIALEVPPARLEAALAVVRSQGEVLKRTATENPDTQNATEAKVGLTVSIVALAGVTPRETVQQTVAAADVPAAYRAVLAAAGGRVRVAELNEQDRQNVSATIEVDVPRASLADFDRATAAAGDTVARSSARSADAENTVDSAVRVRLTITAADRLPPRETTTLAVEVTDADKAAGDAQAAGVAAGGRVVAAEVNRSPAGPATAKVVLDVPLSRLAEVTRELRQLGIVRGVDAARDATAPAGPLAHARVAVDLATADALVADRSGPWASVRHGLSVGLAGLLWSLQLIVVGLCLVVPWAVVAVAVRRAWRWRAGRAV